MEKTDLVFRSAFHGYNRDDVNQYILNMSKRFKEAQDASKEKIDALTAKLAAAGVPTTEDAEDAEASSLAESMEALRAENEELKRALEAAKFEEKVIDSQPFDNLSQQIGSILISANTTASTILNNASSDAEKLRADAENEVNKVKLKLGSEADAILAKFSDELKNVLEQCLAELNSTVNEIQSGAATIAADIQRKNRDMNEKVDYYKKVMSESLSAKLVEMEKSFDAVKGASLSERK
ncbi:MAG: hypothetical protein IJY12_03710 [Clostridia bacterium]|nr:hypothetical protein [Clostridia bacterium]